MSKEDLAQKIGLRTMTMSERMLGTFRKAMAHANSTLEFRDPRKFEMTLPRSGGRELHLVCLVEGADSRWKIKAVQAGDVRLGHMPSAQPASAKAQRYLLDQFLAWLDGAHHGALPRANSTQHIEEFTFFLNRSKVEPRGLVYRELLEWVLRTPPTQGVG